MKYKILTVAALFIIFSCDDMHDVLMVKSENSAGPEQSILVLCEGLFNMNNGTLGYFNEGVYTSDIFKSVNNRALGDTPNSAIVYGNKIYIVVNVSNTLEVIDSKSFKSIYQLNFLNETGKDVQPRCATSSGGYVYVCAFDNNVYKIDTVDFEIKAVCQVGKNPDCITIVNNKIFVSNSGGLSAPDYDNTISVIDIQSFKEIKRFYAGINPGKIVGYGDNMIAVSVRGNYDDIKSDFVIYNTDDYSTVKDFEISMTNFTVYNNKIIGYSSENNTLKYLKIDEDLSVRYYNPEEETIKMPYAIAVDPQTGNIYIGDARNYVESGDMAVFDQDFNLIKKYYSVGLNPSMLIFVSQSSTIIPDITQDTVKMIKVKSVCEYVPAPSQFVNTSTSGYDEGYNYQQVKQKVLNNIQNGSLTTLGGLGGYLTVEFEDYVNNAEGENDIRIDGNAVTGGAEPGIVEVSQDNINWYELKGSAFDQTIRNVNITYRLNEDQTVSWISNTAPYRGTIEKNIYHSQCYFPRWTESPLTFKCSRLPDVGVCDSIGVWILTAFDYGYVDNIPNKSGGNLFDIDNAIDETGNRVNLARIKYLRISSAENQICGRIGEVSTEVGFICGLH